jgi:glutamyl-tRNA reductase
VIIKQPFSFHLIGISFKTCPLAVRERFSFSENDIQHALSVALSKNLNNLLILSTCNRLELFGFVPQKEMLLDVLNASKDELPLEQSGNNFIYHKSGYEAIEHVFNVASGLDSQILGDFQIAGQLRDAHQYSIGAGMNSPELNRLALAAIHCSRKVKTGTAISKGNASVASAAFQFVKNKIENYSAEKFLIIGAGKTGKTILQILSKEVAAENITLVNRTASVAKNLAESFQVQHSDFNNLEQLISQYSVIITAVSANETIIAAELIQQNHITSKLFIDLGVPRNIADEVYHLPGICVVNIDQLKDVCNNTLAQRQQSIPLAKILVHDAVEDFILWLAKRARYSKSNFNGTVKSYVN